SGAPGDPATRRAGHREPDRGRPSVRRAGAGWRGGPTRARPPLGAEPFASPWASATRLARRQTRRRTQPWLMQAVLARNLPPGGQWVEATWWRCSRSSTAGEPGWCLYGWVLGHHPAAARRRGERRARLDGELRREPF